MVKQEPHEYLAANHALWDEWAEIHVRSDWYKVESLRQGECQLFPYEIRELGEVAGRTLLHLQCQIGTDTVAGRGGERG